MFEEIYLVREFREEIYVDFSFFLFGEEDF